MYNNNLGYLPGIGGGGGGGSSNATTIKIKPLNASTGNINYTLPAIDFNSDYVKTQYNIIKYDSSENTVTILPPAGVTFKNCNTPNLYILKNQNDMVKFIATETNVYMRVI